MLSFVNVWVNQPVLSMKIFLVTEKHVAYISWALLPQSGTPGTGTYFLQVLVLVGFDCLKSWVLHWVWYT